MGITAVTSNAIVDSTATGRALITAANAAAARATLDAAGLQADNTFDGTNAFSEVTEFTLGLETPYIEISSTSGSINQPDIAGYTYLAFNGSNVFRASALDFIPMSDGTKALGRSDLRFSDVLSVAGDFSGDLTTNFIKGNNANTMYITQPIATSSVRFRFGADIQYWWLTRSEFRVATNGVGTLGTDAYRFGNVYSQDGSFSGNLNVETGGSFKMFSLGTEGDTDTEALTIDFDSGNSKWEISARTTGTGSARQLWFDASQFRMYESGTLLWIGESNEMRMYGTLVPSSDGLKSVGSASKRFGDYYGVRGNFTGTITNTATTGWAATFDRGIRVGANSGINWYFSNGNNTKFSHSVFFESNFSFARAADGIASRVYRMSKAASAFICVGVDGGVTGNTIFQVEDATDTFQPLRTGGVVNHYADNSGAQAYRMYNLGEFGDADTEYGEISWDSNILYFRSQTTGTATGREVRLTAGLSRVDVKNGGNIQIVYNNTTRAIFGNANITIYKYMQPNSDLGVNFGSATRRWGTAYFGGLVTDVQTITASSDTLASSDHTALCDCTSNAITINLPAANTGRHYVIKKIDSTSNAVTIDPNGSETIDGAATATLTSQYESITLASDGSNWFIT